MRSWINNGGVLLFAVLSVLARLSSFYAGGIWSWISILTLALWGILGINLLLLIILLFTEKKWKAVIPMVAIGLHADYLNAVYQVSSEIPNDNNGMPLTLISYNASHFYWEKQYTLKDAASCIGKYRPDILCLQEAPNENNYHQDSIRQEFGYLKYSCTSFRTDHSPLAISMPLLRAALTPEFFWKMVVMLLYCSLYFLHISDVLSFDPSSIIIISKGTSQLS